MSDPREARTGRRRARFLASLREHGIVARAVRAAGGGRRTFYDWRAEDPGFAAEWDAALALGLAALEDEAMERAWRGRRRGVWYKGRKVGVERRPSDGLLMFLLRHRLPERYGPKAPRGPAMRDGRAMEAMSDEELEHAIAKLLDPEGAGPAPEPSEETKRARALRAAGFLPPEPAPDPAGATQAEAAKPAAEPEPAPDRHAPPAPQVTPPAPQPAPPPAIPAGAPPDSFRDRLAGSAAPRALEAGHPAAAPPDAGTRGPRHWPLPRGRSGPLQDHPF